MKNKTLIIISTLMSVFIIYIFYFSYIFINFKEETNQFFKTTEKLDFHKKYSKKLHHIRDEVGLGFSDEENKVTDLLFTNINEIKNEKLTILLQGDSWIDQINYSPEKNYDSLKMIENFGNKKEIKFINAGIPSYSPSLMHLQLNILENEFKIFPDILVAYIDQTDIGDENCRYKNNIIKKNGKLIGVAPELYSNHLWDYSKIYGLSKIYLDYNSKLLRVFHTINFNFKYGIIKQINKLSVNKTKNKCYYKEIENFLLFPDERNVEYFSAVLNKYLKNIEGKSHIKMVFLVTFPHKKHFYIKENSELYKLNVSDLVDRAVKNKKKIRHINFSKHLKKKKNFNLKNIWAKDKIHLNSKSHANILVKKILLDLEDSIK